MLQLVRALWLASALVPGFVAALLHQMAQARSLYCMSEPGADGFPAAFHHWPNLLGGMTAGNHFLGAALFVPVMAIALFLPARQSWLAVGGAILWMVAVLVRLGFEIPTSCQEAGARVEPLVFYLWPALLVSMMVFRLNTSRQASKKARS